MPNQYVNKVVQSNGTTIIDITDTTAVASDVASGKYFYLANGQRVEGSSSGGGSVTVTEEANTTGITCVITTGGGDDPTPSGDIPLNTQLIDYTQTTGSVELDSYGQAVASDPWYYVSDYTAIDPSMTFSFTGAQWGILAVYDSSKTFVRSFDINDIKDSASNNIAYGTLSGNRIMGAYYVRITAQGNTSTALSLIRTA